MLISVLIVSSLGHIYSTGYVRHGLHNQSFNKSGSLCSDNSPVDENTIFMENL
jgi:hypothetical protein